jgi:hypothetical protein
MYVRKSSKKRKYLIVKLLGTSSSDRFLYVFRCRYSGCINRWDILIKHHAVVLLIEEESSLRCTCATLGGAARCGAWIGSDREEDTLV